MNSLFCSVVTNAGGAAHAARAAGNAGGPQPEVDPWVALAMVVAALTAMFAIVSLSWALAIIDNRRGRQNAK